MSWRTSYAVSLFLAWTGFIGFLQVERLDTLAVISLLLMVSGVGFWVHACFPRNT